MTARPSTSRALTEALPGPRGHHIVRDDRPEGRNDPTPSPASDTRGDPEVGAAQSGPPAFAGVDGRSAHMSAASASAEQRRMTLSGQRPPTSVRRRGPGVERSDGALDASTSARSVLVARARLIDPAPSPGRTVQVSALVGHTLAPIHGSMDVETHKRSPLRLSTLSP